MFLLEASTLYKDISISIQIDLSVTVYKYELYLYNSLNYWAC